MADTLEVNGNMLLSNGTNMFIGSDNNTTTGDGYNTGIGIDALLDNTSGYKNVGIGTYALQNNETGCWNMAIGYCALLDSNNPAGAGNNTACGYKALMNSNTNGHKNCAVGTKACYNITGGYHNTAIGCFAGPTSNTKWFFSNWLQCSMFPSYTIFRVLLLLLLLLLLLILILLILILIFLLLMTMILRKLISLVNIAIGYKALAAGTNALAFGYRAKVIS